MLADRDTLLSLSWANSLSLAYMVLTLAGPYTDEGGKEVCYEGLVCRSKPSKTEVFRSFFLGGIFVDVFLLGVSLLCCELLRYSDEVVDVKVEFLSTYSIVVV